LKLSLRPSRAKSLLPRPRAGWALLFFVAHAFVVGATHLHAADLLDAPAPPAPGVSVGEHEKYRHPDANEHVQCLLCRLQRSLVADLEGVRPVAFAPPDASTPVKAHARPLFLNRSTLVPAGRAPPTA